MLVPKMQLSNEVPLAQPDLIGERKVRFNAMQRNPQEAMGVVTKLKNTLFSAQVGIQPARGMDQHFTRTGDCGGATSGGFGQPTSRFGGTGTDRAHGAAEGL